MTPRLARAAELFSLLAACACVPAGAADWEAIPPSRWQGVVAAEAKPLGRSVAAAVALPAKQAAPLVAESAGPCPPGLYEVRLTLRPSHVADAIAFNSRLRVRTDNAAAESAADAEIPMHLFARAHQPETRTIQCLHRKAGPLRVALECLADPRIAEDAWMKAQLGKGGPAPEVSLDTAGGDAVLDDLEIDVTLAPDRAVYFVVDSVEMRPLSTSGLVKALSIDRIRYLPGSTLAGRATVEDVGGRGGDGSLNIFLEHGVQDRTPAASLPVTLGPRPQEIAFEIRLPERELGYAVVATFVSADGRDRAEAAEYFTIAENFQRVAIFGANSRDFGTRDAVLDEPTIRRGIAASRGDYYNAAEFFSWAEDDLIAMSPAVDFWSSGQTNYRQHKQTMQRQMRIAREQGFAMSTYGKFIMSGLPGWEFAYEHPADHRNQYFYPVGMWDMVNVLDLDRRRGGDFCVYGRGPDVRGHPFQGWWSSFLPVNPDATPANVRAAAEECIRSIDMFGWDAIRWDGHPRGGGQCGSSGAYDRAAARKTQALVRYFKEIIGAKHPDFRHGYNYLLIEKEKRHDWAVEDYELDELCRGGGLLMNESIGNASGGWTFAEVARNLQVDGDLCRERGGYYLGISFAKSPRDVLIESGLWAAAGCRPYGAMSREVRRYCTRYAQYTFDERLRRIAAPEKILVPRAETRLWWQPFVYETPLEGGRRQLVVNLFNVPLEARRPPRDVEVKPEWDMPAGSDPVSFDLRLPAGFRPTGAHLVDPQTLAV
ncbi:MAG: hypothetical protein EBZ59_06940, partial [Planctomycetia bacterium]|nr:hypothetical protein [Planctomycetia bacterium]